MLCCAGAGAHEGGILPGMGPRRRRLGAVPDTPLVALGLLARRLDFVDFEGLGSCGNS